MFQLFRGSDKSIILPDLNAFWKYCDSTQRKNSTPQGPEADAEERLDLAAGGEIKQILEAVIGPEEGGNPLQMQNWDWNDDRTRPVFILAAAFKPEIIPALQSVLVGDFHDFRILIMVQDNWDGDISGGIAITSGLVAVQKNISSTYATA